MASASSIGAVLGRPEPTPSLYLSLVVKDVELKEGQHRLLINTLPVFQTARVANHPFAIARFAINDPLPCMANMLAVRYNLISYCEHLTHVLATKNLVQIIVVVASAATTTTTTVSARRQAIIRLELLKSLNKILGKGGRKVEVSPLMDIDGEIDGGFDPWRGLGDSLHA